MKLSIQEFNKLTREEKREALLNFTAPSNIYQPNKVSYNHKRADAQNEDVISWLFRKESK